MDHMYIIEMVYTAVCKIGERTLQLTGFTTDRHIEEASRRCRSRSHDRLPPLGRRRSEYVITRGSDVPPSKWKPRQARAGGAPWLR